MHIKLIIYRDKLKWVVKPKISTYMDKCLIKFPLN